MEERLYFKPVSYDKDSKEYKPKAKKGSKTKLVKFAIVLFILVAIIIAIIWFLRGETTTSGDFPGPIKSGYLVCQKENPEYGIITPRDPLSSEAKVTFSITESGEMNSASLVYTSVYKDERGAYDSRNVTSGVFDKSLVEAGLNIGALANKFSLYDNKMILTLTAGKGEITSKTAKFFMMEDTGSLDFAKATTSDYRIIYEKQGFSCKTSSEN